MGFSAAPDHRFLDLCAPVFAAVDYLEVLPEGLIAPVDDEGFEPNGFFDRVQRLRDRHGLPLVAHGVGLSVAGAHPLDAARFDRWVARAVALHERLDFGWYTDHWGITAPGGLNLTLPVAPPLCAEVRDAVRARLDRLGEALRIPVGVENSVFYAPWFDLVDEAGFLAQTLTGDQVLLLDVHNLWTHHINLGLDVEAWLADAPLDRVIEIHVSGGDWADPAWIASDRLRLDSHDHGVPDEVFALLEAVLPRCRNLRGVTLERLEGTVEAADVDGLLADLDRIRSAIDAAVPDGVPRPGRPSDAPALGADWELAAADAWTAADPLAALAALPEPLQRSARYAVAAADGVRVGQRLMAALRFERLVQGSAVANGWFASEPAAFTRAFQRYCAEVAPTAFLPADEGGLFERWAQVG